MIKFDNVTKIYRNEKVSSVTAVSFTINPQSYTALIGQNGSGKSTVIKMLLGLEKVSEGDITIFGEPISTFSSWYRIGYVPQNNQKYNRGIPTTVSEVVHTGFLCLKKKLSKVEKAKQIKTILENLGLGGFENKVLLELSGGQQQRVFVARALVHDPDLLIFDEPTVGVDQQNVRQFYTLIDKLHHEGKTIVLVSHDVHGMNNKVTDVISLNGELQFSGKRIEYTKWHENHCESC